MHQTPNLLEGLEPSRPKPIISKKALMVSLGFIGFTIIYNTIASIQYFKLLPGEILSPTDMFGHAIGAFARSILYSLGTALPAAVVICMIPFKNYRYARKFWPVFLILVILAQVAGCVQITRSYFVLKSILENIK